jgi:uncharacterized membrane protein
VVEAMSWAVVLFGALAAVAGIVLLVAGIRGGAGNNPKATVKLMGGMMLTAFGILIAGFTIGFASADPLPPASPEATP